MAIDINNLPEILKTGKIHGEGTRAILETPLCRASFANLVEEETYLGNPTGRHSITLLIETDPARPGAVDTKPAFLPFFKATLAAYQIKATFTNAGCVVGKQTLFTCGEKISQEGKVYQGHGPGTVSLKANSKITVSNPGVVCYNALGEVADPEIIYGGCYVRAKIGIYKPQAFPNLSITLKSVQFVADGERFSADGMAMDGIEGAEPAGPAATPDNDLSAFVG